MGVVVGGAGWGRGVDWQQISWEGLVGVGAWFGGRSRGLGWVWVGVEWVVVASDDGWVVVGSWWWCDGGGSRVVGRGGNGGGGVAVVRGGGSGGLWAVGSGAGRWRWEGGGQWG